MFSDIEWKMNLLLKYKTDCPSDRPSIQSRASLTDNLSRLTNTQNKYCVSYYDIYFIHSHYKETKKEVPRPKPRYHSYDGDTFVIAINKVNGVAADTMFVSRCNKFE